MNLTDALIALNYFFLEGPAPACLDSADTDDDGVLNLTDGVFLLNFLFLDGPLPAAPFPDQGVDPTEDELSCLN